MNQKDGKKLVCLLIVSIFATAFSLTPVALSDWLPNPSASSDFAENAGQADLSDTIRSSDVSSSSDTGLLAFDSGFRPDTDGFAFENYGDEYGSVGLTEAEMQRLFGKQVCSGDADCTLLPNARRWMEENNKDMIGGHCEGMAVLSLLFFLGILDPQKFGATTTHELSIEENEPLQREIAYWWATQCTDPAENVTVNGPTQVLNALTKELSDSDNTPNSWTAGVAKEDGSGGHSVTPFAIRDKGDDLYEILVYDNNYPDEIKTINIDAADNAFTYDTSSDPDEESSAYTGHNLNLTGTNDRLVQQKCDFCQDDGGVEGTPEQTTSPALSRRVQVRQDGGADMLIKDDQGRRLGRLKDGTVVNEIPGSKVHWFMKSTSRNVGKPRNNTSDYLLQLPYGVNYTVSLNQADSEKVKAQSVTSIGPGYYTEVGGLAVRNESEGMDLVEFHSRKNGYQAVSYRSAEDKTPLLRGGTNSGNGTAYEFLVAKNYTKNATNLSSTKRQHDAPDERTFLAIERSSGKLLVGSKAKVDNKTIDKERYDLMVAKLSKKGPEIFSHKGIALLPGAVMIADYASWQGEGHALAVSIDENEDGVADETLNLADEGGSYEDVIEADAETANEESEGVGLAQDSETGNDGDAGAANSGSATAGDGTTSGMDVDSGLGGDSDGE
jgi:hypothetical protein